MTDNGSFKRIEDELVPLLGLIGKTIKNQKLISANLSANHTIGNYYKFLNKLETEEDIKPVTKLPNPPSTISQQNASVDSIISNVLSRIDRTNAGEISHILARSDNKLAVLHQELNSRGIRL